MPLPRLTFLYPALRRRSQPPTSRYRHGTAVEPPTQLHPPPVPPPPRTDPDTKPKGRPSRSFLGVAAEEEKPQGSVTEALLDTVGVQDAGGVTGGDANSTRTGEETTPHPAPDPSGKRTSTSAFTPREYVHHFDTYTSVRRLESGGYKGGQSIAIMKGIRSLLDKNMTAARENLISKSDIENETYLFQAACSELRNEMQNTKKGQMDHLRSERTRIQTEFDLLNQAFLAEMMTLKDELNGMFNDRKMVTRAEQRAMENKIQELNYKITILIQSELKSEIEKLRWTTTRRGLIAIASLALFVVASIRVNNSSTEKKHKEKEKERIKKELEELEAKRHYEGHRIVTGETTRAGLVSLG